MSVSAIMKNILSFAEILSQSTGRAAEHWDKCALQNAVKWSAYCEQIYQQAVSKGFVDELDKQVRGLLIYLRPATCMELSLLTLSHATSLLKQNLLQNPYISNDLFENVMCLYETEDNPTALIKTIVHIRVMLSTDCSEIASYTALSEIVSSVIQTVTPQQTDSLSSFQGEQLLTTLVKQKKEHPDIETRFSDFVTQLLKQLANEESGWDVIFHSFLSTVEGSPQETEFIKKIILKFICQSGSSFAQWTDKELLCKTSCSSDQFYEHYINTLIRWGENLYVTYNPPGSKPLYTWRATQPEPSKSFQSQVDHWFRLTNDMSIGNDSTQKFQELLLRDEPNIWRDIRKNFKSFNSN